MCWIDYDSVNCSCTIDIPFFVPLACSLGISSGNSLFVEELCFSEGAFRNLKLFRIRFWSCSGKSLKENYEICKKSQHKIMLLSCLLTYELLLLRENGNSSQEKWQRYILLILDNGINSGHCNFFGCIEYQISGWV